MGVKRNASYQNEENMAKKTDEELYDVAINMIGSVAKLPVIRVDREAFLRQQFADSEYLDEILEHGPQHVYTVESLRKKADGVIKKSTNQTTLAAFVAGIPGGPAAVAAGGAKVRVLAYLGVMLGASGSAMLVGKLAREVGKNMGTKIMQQAEVA